MRLVLVLLTNLAALLPVWLGHWSVFALIGLYWFENVATGVVQVLRMRAAEKVQGTPFTGPLSTFFAVHYGLFTAVHGIFVAVFFGVMLEGAHDGGAAFWWLSAAIVAGLHYLDYRRDYVRGDQARRVAIDRLMWEPYPRVAVLHVFVLGGGLLALKTQEPRDALLALVGLKLVVELIQAWRRDARARRPVDATSRR